MSLFSALNIASRGLDYNQNALSVVAQNVAGANDPNYVRREYQSDGASGIGDAVRRSLDSFLQKQMWRESGSSGFTSAQSHFMTELDTLFGVPGSNSTLSARFDDFTKSMRALQTDPGSSVNRSTVIAAAQRLVGGLSDLSNGIQTLRSGTEQALSDATADANDALTTIAELNRRIANSAGKSDPSLLDIRDGALQKLSALLPISVTMGSDGTANVSTTNGILLVDPSGAKTLSFDSHGTLNASSVYDFDASKRSVGSVTLNGAGSGSVDLIASGALKNGRIGGLIDLRDNLLVKAQAQIDDIAAGLASALSDTDVASTPVTGGFDLDISGLQSGNSIALSYVDSAGKSHKVSIIRVEDATKLPLSNDTTADPNDEVIGISFAGGVAGAKTSLQSQLDSIGAGLSVNAGTNGALRLTAASPASVTSLSARVTTTALTGQGTGMPLFVDSAANNGPFTDSLDGTAQRTGFASRMVVNPSLLSDASYLSVYQSPANAAADPARPTDLIQRLEKVGVTSSAQAGLGLGGTKIPIGQLLRQTVQANANEVLRVNSSNDNQTLIQNAIEAKFTKSSGVNMDKELSDMTQLQNAYTANARVLSAVKDMFDVLMRL